MNRVWTYIIPRNLTSAELASLQQKGEEFVKGWTAHENRLSASFELVQNRIVLVKVNEDVHGASGCSIDKLTRFIKDAGKELGTDLLDRMQVAYENKPGAVEVSSAKDIPYLLQSGKISGDTPVYNTSVATEAEMRNWKQPLKNTWLKKYLQSA